MSARDQRIGPTAHYTAYVWKRLGMPYAEHFVTPTGAALFWSFRFAGEWIAAVSPRVPSMTQYLALRHRLIEGELDRLQPDRIVEIGAGLSRRGVTWAADRGVDYVEIDLPHMTAHKRDRLEALPASLKRRVDEKLRLVSHDVLSSEFDRALAAEIGDAVRPVVVAEGLMGYFDRDEQTRLARSIRSALAPRNGSFLCDLRASEGGRSVAFAARFLKAGIRLITRGRGVRADFRDTEDVRAFFAEAGFSSATPADPSTLHDLAHVPSPARVWHARA